MIIIGNAVPTTNQSQEATPAITPSTTTASSGTSSVSLCTKPSDNSIITAPFVTLPRSNSEGHTGPNSKFVPGAPTVLQKMRQAQSHPPYNYSPRVSVQYLKINDCKFVGIPNTPKPF